MSTDEQDLLRLVLSSPAFPRALARLADSRRARDVAPPRVRSPVLDDLQHGFERSMVEAQNSEADTKKFDLALRCLGILADVYSPPLDSDVIVAL